ncbi:MAG TPA: LacI family DNA-binding transcriptional regulator [Opitutaceae bacterium]|nr:LacI family DNA-binding transcriptional regulator [Opitutaceae bacterium]
MEPGGIITHRDIAARVGCDRSTVSLALRGSPKIAAELRRKIKAVAEELGYRPDPAIALLARHRWARHKADFRATIAYLVDKKRGSYRLQKRHFESARARAEENGYVLTEFDLSVYPTAEAAGRVLSNRGIRGLIVPALPREAEADLRLLDLDKFTIVRCSLGWLRTPFHAIGPDFFECTRLAWRKVAELGYRRIGAALFRHTPVAVDDDTRLAASYLEQAGLVPQEDRIPFLLSDPADKDAFNQWFDRYKPDAIIGLLHTVHGWLEEGGVRVPQDVAFACLNVFSYMPFSGISVQIDEVGRTAMDLMISQLSENMWGVPTDQKIVMLEPHWVDGETMPPAKSVPTSGVRAARKSRAKLSSKAR